MRVPNLKVAHVERWVPLSMNAGVFCFDETSADNTIASTSVIQKEQVQSNQSVLKTYQLLLVSSFSEHGQTSLCANGRSTVQTLLNVYENKLVFKGTSVIGRSPLVACWTWKVYGAMSDSIDTMHQRIYRLDDLSWQQHHAEAGLWIGSNKTIEVWDVMLGLFGGKTDVSKLKELCYYGGIRINSYTERGIAPLVAPKLPASILSVRLLGLKKKKRK